VPIGVTVVAGLSRRSGAPASRLPRRQVRRSPGFTHGDVGPSLPTRDAPDAPRLVGRVGELAAIRRALDDLDRRSGFLQLSGDPGAGKTRLLTELADQARQRGITVFSTRSCDGAQPVPFEPLIEALGDRMRAEPVRQRAGDTGVALLAAHFTGACDYPRPDALAQPGARLALFSALRRWPGTRSPADCWSRWRCGPGRPRPGCAARWCGARCTPRSPGSSWGHSVAPRPVS
jgi:hypothetical protein